MSAFRTLLAATLVALPAPALADPLADNEAPVQAFARFSFQQPAEEERLSLGIGAYRPHACTSATLTSETCVRERRGVEVRWINGAFAAYSVGPGPDLRLQTAGGRNNLNGESTFLWIGLGVATVLVLAEAAALDDDDTDLCPVNTIPNPLTGDCEPFQP